ncbi:MAG: hypothetical protein ABI851_00205 [Saprospiraceae bacterium]
MKKVKVVGLIIQLLCLSITLSYSQEYEISPELDLRNDFSYYVVPIDKEVCVIRNKAVRILLQKLDADQTWTIEKELNLEGKKWNILDVYRHHDMFGILYLCKVDKNIRCYYSVFDVNGNKKFQRRIIDSTEILSMENVSFQFSEDKKFCTVGIRDMQNKPWVVLYNRLQDSIYYTIKANEVYDIRNGLAEEAFLSNSGEFYLMAVEENSYKSETKNIPRIIGANASGKKFLDQQIITDEEIVSAKLSYHNSTNELIFVGLCNEKESQKISSYILKNLTKDAEVKTYTFEEKYITEWSGKRNSSVINGYNLKLRDVKFLFDGSCMLFMENVKQYVRRPYFGAGIENNGAFTNNRWIDYYYDDILVSCINSNGEKKWETILHKKQFSQDDEGINSSFFIVTNKSFLRIIFNDEIKNETTVSEYILLADGETNRKSILNTSNNKLHLRIKDASQVDANSIIVPSENAGRLSIMHLVLN